MKLPQKPKQSLKNAVGKIRASYRNRIALQGGTYALAVTALVLVILIVVNVLVSALPASATQFDISSTRLYSITSNTKVVVNALEEDVTIYWIVQSGEEDDVIENLLEKYENLSDHIKVVKKNPDIYPTFAAQYTDGEVYNNSLVVESGDRSRYIGYDEIYTYEMNMTSYSYDTSFDGEGALTSAIDYVVSEEQPKLYVLEGHGEAELSESFRNQIEKENIETVSFSLLTEKEVPEDADCVLIYAPSGDISEEEKDLLTSYAENGGRLMVLAGPTEDGTLENLYAVLADYGVSVNEGIVVESDSTAYAFQAPYVLLPEISSHEITDPLLEETSYVLMPIAQGLTIGNSDAVTELLSSSDSSYSKADGYSLSTYDKESGDIDGPFALAVEVSCGNDGKIIWFASSEFLSDTYISYSSGANLDLGMNALT
ncbi:MAG: Gldg family protein, partial [Clostridia bacterium]